MGRILRRCFLAVLLLTVLPAWAEEMVLEVLTLKYRTADEILPVVRPLVDRQGSVSGMNNRLIVRTTPANLVELRRVLDELDRAPRRLLITVRQSSDRGEEGGGASLSGGVSGGRGRIVLPEDKSDKGAAVEYRQGSDSLRARVYGTQTLEAGGETQQIQVLEGKPAYIQVGRTMPVPQRQTVISGGKVVVYDTTTYQDATRGFYVLPRVSGNTVTLEINPQNNTLGNRPGEVNVQQISTVVSGRLGEWMEVGGVDRESRIETGGTVYSTRSLAAEQRKVLLKVEELP